MDGHVYNMNLQSAEQAHYDLVVEKLKTGDYFEYIAALSGFENIDFQDQDGCSLVHACVNFCNYPALLSTIARNANVDLQNKEKLTPLHLAIWKGFLPIAAALLKAGANPNIVDSEGRVPLYYAVRRNDLQAMRLLLQFKAEPNATNRGASLMATAAHSGYAEAIQMLIDANADPQVGKIPPLIEVLHSGSKTALAVLLENRLSDLVKCFDGNILLWHAANMESSLLPVIAAITKTEIDKMRAMNASNIPRFPPSNLKRLQKNQLVESLALNQALPSIDSVKQAVKRIKTPWK